MKTHLVVVCLMGLMSLYVGSFYLSTQLWCSNRADIQSIFKGSSQFIDWRQVFDFIPDGMPLCNNLFPEVGKGRVVLAKELRQGLSDLEAELLKVLPRYNLVWEDVDGNTGRYAREYHALWLLASKSRTFVNSFCETGFNAGHSSLNWLLANKNADVLSFDAGLNPYSRPMVSYLRTKFRGRFNIIWGDSKTTLPQFRKAFPDFKCDFVFIDGGHEKETVESDWQNFRAMTTPNSIVVLDNYPDKRFSNLGSFWEQAKRDGDIIEIFRCHFNFSNQGFTVGRINV